MSNSPKVSIVMVNYNGIKYLKETIPSILKLKYQDLEFIIVDNGSSDGSVEFIKEYRDVKLIISQRIGEKNFACNLGANSATGKYILFLDNDVVINDDYIVTNLLKEASELKDFGCYSLSLVNKNEKKTQLYGVYLNYFFSKNNKNIPKDRLVLLHNVYIGYPNGAAFFIEREKWNEVGGYDDYLSFGGDDNDLGMKLWLCGYKCFLYSRSVQTHIGMAERVNNLKYSKKLKNIIFAQLYTITKNYNKYNFIVAIFCCSVVSFLKVLKQTVWRRHHGPIVGFLKGYFLFLKELPIILRKRRQIQINRTNNKDVFLEIKPPKLIKNV